MLAPTSNRSRLHRPPLLRMQSRLKKVSKSPPTQLHWRAYGVATTTSFRTMTVKWCSSMRYLLCTCTASLRELMTPFIRSYSPTQSSSANVLTNLDGTRKLKVKISRSRKTPNFVIEWRKNSSALQTMQNMRQRFATNSWLYIWSTSAIASLISQSQTR